MAAAATCLGDSPGNGGPRSPQRLSYHLDEILSNSRARIQQWAKDRIEAAREDAQCGRVEASNDLAGLADLKADLQEILQQTEAMELIEEEGEMLEQVIAGHIEAEADRRKIHMQMRDDLNKENETLSQQLQHEEQKLGSQETKLREWRDEVDKFLGYYQEHLGLAFAHTGPHTFRVMFSKLDPLDERREFSFTLSLRSRGDEQLELFCVTACEPWLPQMDCLVEALNQDPSAHTAVPKFFCAVRRAFKDTLASHPTAA